MFKKDRDLTERSKTLLKNKECRNLRSEVLKQFPSITEDEITSLIANKAAVTATKLASKTILYSINNVVYFFDLNARNNLYPTIHALWAIPHMLKSYVIHSPVSGFVLKGADLMLPGVCQIMSPVPGSDDILEGDKVCVKVLGNPLPFAVGDSVLSVSQSLLQTTERKKGRAMVPLQVFGDLLSGSVVPNAGFEDSSLIRPIEDMSAIYGDDSDSGSDNGDEFVEGDHGTGICEEQEGKGSMELKKEDDDKITVKGICDSKIDNNIDVDAEEDKDRLDVDGEGEGEAEGEGNSADKETHNALTKEEEDERLMTAVLLAFKYIVKDPMLPMLVSTFWSIMQRCDPEGREVKIKRSSYRKVSSFLTYCSRQQLLSVQEDSGVAEVIAVSRTHELFRGIKVPNPDAFKARVAASDNPVSAAEAVAATGGGTASFSQQSSTAGTGGGIKITGVVELLKPPKTMREVFGAVRGEFGECLRLGEVKQALVEYLRQHASLVPGDKASVQMSCQDPLLKLLPKDLSKAVEPLPPHPPTTTEQIEDNEEEVDWDKLQTYDDDERDQGSLSAGVVDLSLSSLPSSACAEIGMKIHKDGLCNIDTKKSGDRLNSMGNTINSSSSNSSSSSSYWRPVSLPPPKAVSVIQKGSSNSRQGYDNKSKKKKKAQEEVDPNAVCELRKDALIKAVAAKMSPYYVILGSRSSSGGWRGTVHSGSLPKARVILESRMGNKTVTIVRSLEVFELDLVALTKAFRQRFACSVSLSAVAGIPQDKEIVVQGSFANEVEGYLIDQCGVPRHLVQVTTTKGTKLKKMK